MSITSSNDKPTNADFSDLLAHNPPLATWLTETVNSNPEPQAETLLAFFLEQCTNQGVAANAYPFIVADQGLADLRAFLQHRNGRTGAVPAPSRSHANVVASSPIPQGVHKNQGHKRQTNRALRKSPALTSASRREEEQLTEKRQAIKPASASQPQETTSLAEVQAEIQSVPDEAAPEPEIAVIGEEDLTALATLLDVPVVTLSQPEGVEARVEQTEELESAFASQPENGEIVAVSEFVDDQGVVEPGVGVAEKEDIATKATALDIVAMSAVRAEEVENGVKGKVAREKSQAGSKTNAASMPDASRKGRVRVRRPRSRRRRIISWILLVAILSAILVPAGFLISFGINAYSTYQELGTDAHSAVGHLMNVKNIFSSGGQLHLTQILDVKKLQQAKSELLASEHDFQVLQDRLDHSETISTITTYLPKYQPAVQSAHQASIIGIDVAKMGLIATNNVIQVAPAFSGPLLSASGKPLVTQPILNIVGTTITEVLPLLSDIQIHSQNLALGALPVSASQKTQVGQVLQLLPQGIQYLGQVRDLLGSAGWLLGVDQPRTFLVQTMDRAELRGSGGFTGQYGELKINSGRVGTFSLQNIATLEYADNSITRGQQAPTQYSSWWPFPNWGLRDSNVSADFPTTAQLAINLYKQESGDQVDGVISFTPTVIEHILTVTGPIYVATYKTTVDANNLEDILHYYQLDNNGIQKQITVTGGQANDVRKAFTSQLATMLIQKVRSASPDLLFAITQRVLSDLRTKDLQIYFTNPAAEKVLIQYNYAAQLSRSQTHDGLFVVQENLSASKAAQYVQTIMHDTVTLDTKGGATHVLQLRLIYNQAGPVYGYDTYYDYVRVYVPPDSHLLSSDGFSTGTPLCGGNYGSCPVDNVYPNGELTCPSGQYQPGATPPNNAGSDGGTWMPLQTLGGPTNTNSDEAGRAMYGGWVIVPKNCTMNVTLSWYVPPQSHQPYSLLVQRQSGTFPELDLTILPTTAACTSLGVTGLHFDKNLTQDTSFTPPTFNSTAQGTQGCHPKQST